jgi:uncharacterized protein (TIGR00369 family)
VVNQPPSSQEIFDHVQAIFGDAAFVAHLGIKLEAAGQGWCETSLVVAPEHMQQHGYAHAGVVTTLADHTCGGAARSGVAAGADVITIELKINFLRPATAPRLRARGQTLKTGRTVIVVESEVRSADEPNVLIAKCMSTLAVIPQGQRLARTNA